MNTNTRQEITDHLSNVMEKIIHRRTVEEPFNQEGIIVGNPFGYRLVPIEVWKGAKFERSFVTTLGQGIFEQLGKIIALGSGAEASNQHVENLTVCTWRLEKIGEILKAQRQSKLSPNWEKEVTEVLKLDNERYENVSVTSDLFIRRPDGTKEFYSFKTVKPNLDQTERAKRDMLWLISGDSANQPYFALPYNPSGEGKPYGFSIPKKIFDFNNDECVLIGSKLWNKIGNDENTYDELLELFEEVGSQYSPRIRREYFGIE